MPRGKKKATDASPSSSSKQVNFVNLRKYKIYERGWKGEWVLICCYITEIRR